MGESGEREEGVRHSAPLGSPHNEAEAQSVAMREVHSLPSWAVGSPRE
jgi:hypothetical protein